MAEKQIQQEELIPEPTRSRRQNSANGNGNGHKKRSSTRKTTPKLAESNGANGTNGSSPKKTRPRKQQKPADATASTRVGSVSGTPLTRRAPSKKSAPPTRRRTARPVKKQAAAPETQEIVTDAEADSPVLSTDISKHADTIEVEADVEVESGVEVEADVLQFEPEPDPTPVKPKDTSSRPLLLIDAELDALLTELESEAAASELEETMKRPAMRMPGEAETDNLVEEAASSEADATPPVKEAPFEDYDMPAVEGDFLEGEFVVEEEVYYALVDTPLPETAESEQEAPAIPDTPLPPISEQLDIPDTPLPATSKQLDIPDTPWPWPELKTPPAIKIELPRPELVQLRTLLRRPLIRHAVALFSLILLITSSLLLWQNLNETHLYLYHIDATSGKTLAQQDLGVFQDISSLTNPALDQSSLLLGVSTTQSKQQQVLSLSGSDTSWNVSREFSAPPGRATLSIAPGHKLAIEDAGGLQVMTSAGRALWQAPG
ncbi:MAG TPA: hypothetical protein VKR83_20415, partial [Ktedonobacteraceae bacterium]|nr:hypothetical protein [Ktedonobacteraceae bacterium]